MGHDAVRGISRIDALGPEVAVDHATHLFRATSACQLARRQACLTYSSAFHDSSPHGAPVAMRSLSYSRHRRRIVGLSEPANGTFCLCGHTSALAHCISPPSSSCWLAVRGSRLRDAPPSPLPPPSGFFAVLRADGGGACARGLACAGRFLTGSTGDFCRPGSGDHDHGDSDDGQYSQ